MPVAMVQIGIVRMPVDEPRMPMPMRMRLPRRDIRAMFMVMLVMRVMGMAMFMLHLLMDMIVLMPLRQMQPEANPHQPACDQEF